MIITFENNQIYCPAPGICSADILWQK